jgi:hypothetical protein
MVAMAELGPAVSPLFRPSFVQADRTIIFLSPRRPSRTPPSAMPRPAALLPPADVAQAADARGQAASGHHGMTQGHLWVRASPLMLLHHSIASDELPPAATGRFPQILLCSFATRDPELEFDRRKGPFCEVSDTNE